MPKKRIFIAISISKEIQKKATTLQKELKDLDIRWLHSHNLHITLIPPWNEDDFKKVKKILKTQITTKFKSFTLNFKKIIFGPPSKSSSRPPRMIWAIGPTPPELIRLKKQLEKTLLNEKIIHKTASRPFRLHLTLARFKPKDFKNFPIQTLNKDVTWKQKVTSFTLMQSHLSHTHAEYKILEEVKI
jgi:2'-5' RNA ligase